MNISWVMRKFHLLTPVGKLRMYSLKMIGKMMESLLIEWGIGMSAFLSI